MFNYKIFIDGIYNVISQKQTFFEILLNITFVLIIFLLIVIFYWDSINRSIIKKNRCKIHINNEDKNYNVEVLDNNNNKLVNISYDNTSKHNVKVDCVCPTGDVINKFNIYAYNHESKTREQRDKICKCDSDYTTFADDYKYTGDQFLVDYYNANQYNLLLEFPN
jgi:hypothetical protein